MRDATADAEPESVTDTFEGKEANADADRAAMDEAGTFTTEDAASGDAGDAIRSASTEGMSDANDEAEIVASWETESFATAEAESDANADAGRRVPTWETGMLTVADQDDGLDILTPFL